MQVLDGPNLYIIADQRFPAVALCTPRGLIFEIKPLCEDSWMMLGQLARHSVGPFAPPVAQVTPSRMAAVLFSKGQMRYHNDASFGLF